MHQKWETVLSKREHSFMGHSHWKISRSVLFFVIAFLWIVEATQLLFILYHCVLAIFLILKNCQVSVIFCHCFSLNSGSRSIAVYFVSLCPGNVSNSEKLPGQWYFFVIAFLWIVEAAQLLLIYILGDVQDIRAFYIKSSFIGTVRHGFAPDSYIKSSFFGTVQHGFAPDSSCGSETVVQFGTICHHSTQICTKLWCRANAYVPKVRDCT